MAINTEPTGPGRRNYAGILQVRNFYHRLVRVSVAIFRYLNIYFYWENRAELLPGGQRPGSRQEKNRECVLARPGKERILYCSAG